MRIALVTEYSNVSLSSLADSLTHMGHEVRVYTFRESADPDQSVTESDPLTIARRLGRSLQKQWDGAWKPDIAHAHCWLAGIATHIAAGQLDVPVVMSFHGLGVIEKRHLGSSDTSPLIRSRMERFLALSSARVIATSIDEVGELIRMGMSRRQAVVIPNGVDTGLFTRTGPMWPRTDRFRILFVGFLTARKGVATIIQALARVPHAELLIAGGPHQSNLIHDHEANRLADIAQHVNVANRVFFLGDIPHTQLPPLYRSADLVVTVPWYEPFGTEALEAMACGKPVVGSAVGGHIDTIIDGVTGVLVPPRRPDLLASAIRHLMLNPFERQAMGIAAADRAANRFSWERIATEISHVYEGVAAKATHIDLTSVESEVRL